MLNGDAIFAAAEKAVGDAALNIQPDLAGRWQGVVPNDMGLNGDNWLQLSAGCSRRLRSSAVECPPPSARISIILRHFVVAKATTYATSET